MTPAYLPPQEGSPGSFESTLWVYRHVQCTEYYSDTRIIAIPRLPKWKKSPAEAVESRLNEIKAVIALIAHDANPDEGQELIASVSKLSLALAGGADDKSKVYMLYPCAIFGTDRIPAGTLALSRRGVYFCFPQC